MRVRMAIRSGWSIYLSVYYLLGSVYSGNGLDELGDGRPAVRGAVDAADVVDKRAVYPAHAARDKHVEWHVGAVDGGHVEVH